MRISLFGLVVSSLVGCATSDPAQGEQSEMVTAQPLPTTTGSFRGHYVVPAPASVAAAATFAMPEVDWTVVGGALTLHYELPVGLVGGTLPVSLGGSIASGAVSVQLTTGSGTGSCTAAGTKITCSEAFGSLGALPISMAVVQQVAVQDNIAPASRTTVANVFGSDPIGTVDFDLTTPVDDHGGGGGGHGGHDGGGDGGRH